MNHVALIVDDDPEFRAFTSSLLAPRGYDVREAGRLDEARAQLDRGAVELAIVDGLLPDGTGMEFIGELRARCPDAKVIFVSAFWRDMHTFKTLTQELSVTRVLSKPCGARELLIQLDSIAAQDTAVADGRESAPQLEREGFETQLSALREAYSERLAEKVRELAEAYAVARARGLPPELLERALRLAHKLHGTAGAYGFTEISGAAATIEGVLREVSQGRLAPEVAAWRQVNRGLKQLSEALGRRQEVLLLAAPHGPVESYRKYDLRVLVADADGAFLDAVESAGRRNLVDVVRAPTLEQALELAGAEALDGALVAVRWDGDDAAGFRLVQALRSRDSNASLPVAFVGDPDIGLRDRVAAAYAGTSLFLTRPLSTEGLATAFEYFGSIKRTDEPRVLVLDDDAAFCDYLATLLRREGMAVDTLVDPGGVLDALASRRPDLLILDVAMPTLSGHDVCRLLRASPEWQALPILFLTSRHEAADRLACFEAGGDDYLPKPAVHAELLARIRVRLERQRMVRERMNRDALTGLLARQAFADAVEKRLAENRRSMRPLALCLLDLDRFKQVNDTHGHLAGDRVLKAIGKLLHSRFRTEDVRGRWGGEEFVVAFNGEGVEAARDMLSRVAAELRQMTFEDDRGETFTTSFSAGIAIFPDDGWSLEELIRAADSRLYAAKAAGRDRVVA